MARGHALKQTPNTPKRSHCQTKLPSPEVVLLSSQVESGAVEQAAGEVLPKVSLASAGSERPEAAASVDPAKAQADARSREKALCGAGRDR